MQLHQNPLGADQLDGKVLVHCTNSLDDVNKDYDADHAVVGDAKLVLTQLIEEPGRSWVRFGRSIEVSGRRDQCGEG